MSDVTQYDVTVKGYCVYDDANRTLAPIGTKLVAASDYDALQRRVEELEAQADICETYPAYKREKVLRCKAETRLAACQEALRDIEPFVSAMRGDAHHSVIAIRKALAQEGEG